MRSVAVIIFCGCVSWAALASPVQSEERLLIQRGAVGTSDYDVYSMQPDGSEMRLIYDSPYQAGESGVWSPDGTEAIIPVQSSPYSYWDLFAVDSDGANPTLLVSLGPGRSTISPRFRADSLLWFEAAFVDSSVSEIYQLDLSTGDTTRLTDFGNNDGHRVLWFDFSDTAIYYIKQDATGACSGDIYSARIESDSIVTASESIVVGRYGRDWLTDLSPDGTKILFYSPEAANCYEDPHNIWVVNVDGTGLTQLTFATGTQTCNYPQWSPDGRRIAYAFRNGDQFDIWIMNADGSDNRAITSTPGISARPCDWQYVPTEFVAFPPAILAPGPTSPSLQPVSLTLTQPIKGGMIPFKFPAGVKPVGISLAGLVTENWMVQIDSISCPNAWAVGLYNTLGETIPAGTNTIFNIEFELDGAERLCNESWYIHWDTACMGDPQHELLLADTNNLDLACHFEPGVDSTEILGYMPGDLTDDGLIAIADLTYFIAYLFRGEPPPCVVNSADCNGNCTGPNIADMTYLIAYLFQGGNAPLCGCLGSGKAAKAVGRGALVAQFDGEATVLTVASEIALRGIQITLKGEGVPKPASLTDSRIELLGGSTRIGLVDLEGIAVIEAGTREIVRIPGEWKIVEAIGSDVEHREVLLASAGEETLLPDEFSLDQNFPNPFNPTTRIGFALPAASDVRLVVYNVMGQIVAVVADGRFEAGSHSVEWNGCDAGGTPAASGIYLYRLETAAHTETRKMLLLK